MMHKKISIEEIIEQYKEARDEFEITYVFQKFNKEKGQYLPCIDLRKLSTLTSSEKFKEPQFYCIDLYEGNDNLREASELFLKSCFYEFYWKYLHQVHGNQITRVEKKVIMTEDEYDEIQKVIREYNLGLYTDFIIEMIATVQRYAIDKFKGGEEKVSEADAEKDSKSLIAVLKRFENGELPTTIKFSYPFNGEIKPIKNSDLQREMLEAFKEKYDRKLLGNWEKELESFLDRYYVQNNEMQFYNCLAFSFKNFFFQMDIFDTTNSDKPVMMLNCIVSILELCLIMGTEHDYDSSRAKIVSNWIKRYNIPSGELQLKDQEYMQDLASYFRPELKFKPEFDWSIDSYTIVRLIEERFDFKQCTQELDSIVQYLQNEKFLDAKDVLEEQVDVDEYARFSKLLENIGMGKKLKAIKIQFEADDEELDVNQDLPLYILQNALKSGLVEQKIELDIGVSKINSDGMLGFALPANRRMVWFVKDLDTYFREELSSTKAEKSYEIIAALLKSTVFHISNYSEEFIQSKVKGWCRL